MNAITDLYYARYQWENFRDRLVNLENPQKHDIHNYFVLYEALVILILLTILHLKLAPTKI